MLLFGELIARAMPLGRMSCGFEPLCQKGVEKSVSLPMSPESDLVKDWKKRKFMGESHNESKGREGGSLSNDPGGSRPIYRPKLNLQELPDFLYSIS